MHQAEHEVYGHEQVQSYSIDGFPDVLAFRLSIAKLNQNQSSYSKNETIKVLLHWKI